MTTRHGLTEREQVILAAINSNTLPDESRIRIRVVSALTGYGQSTIWRDVARGDFPTPIKVGWTCGWRLGDIREHMRKIAAAQGVAA